MLNLLIIMQSYIHENSVTIPQENQAALTRRMSWFWSHPEKPKPPCVLWQGKAQHDLYPVVQNQEKEQKQTQQVYTIFRTVPASFFFKKQRSWKRACITLAILEVHENLMMILVLCFPYETSRSVYSLLQICYRCAGRSADNVQIICRMSAECLQNICRASVATICNKSANLQTLCRQNQPIMLNKEPTKCTNQTKFI